MAVIHKARRMICVGSAAGQAREPPGGGGGGGALGPAAKIGALGVVLLRV